MKKTLLVLLASSLLVNANNYKEASKKELISKEIKKHSNDLKDSPKVIGIAMQETIKALALIQQNKLKDAQKILEDAYAKFNKVLKNNPKLTLIPLDEEIMVFQIEGDSKTIKKAIDLSLNLLKNYDTQVARDILMPLKDEIDINIISLPMNLYPKAIKEAIEALKKDNKNLAINSLKKAFSTLLLTRAVIPIPLLIAQDLIKGASTINDKEKAIALLQKAKDELQKAYYLGYTKKYAPTYKELNKEIDNIIKEIKGANKTKELYKNLNSNIEKFIEKLRATQEKVKNPALKKVEEFQKNEMIKAIKEKAIFSKEVKEDLKKAIRK